MRCEEEGFELSRHNLAPMYNWRNEQVGVSHETAADREANKLEGSMDL